MADPDITTGTTGGTPDRRDRRRRRTRRRSRRAGAVIVAFVVVAAIILFTTDIVHFGGDDKPSLAGTSRDYGPDDAPDATTTTANARDCRPLSDSDPLRLWIGGDSLAGSLGPALGTLTGATGVVQPYFDSRVSSGLANPGFFDWPDHATDEMARLDPEVVVFIIGANDFGAASGSSKANYSDDLDTMMTTLVGSGRTVYWLGAPTLRDQRMDDGVVEVNALAQDVAKRNPKVHYVDTYKLFSDTDDAFSTQLPDETGKVVTMRAGDGVHLTADGAGYLARNMFKLLDTQCAITEQKVEGATKATIQTKGSTQVARGSSSGSGSSGGTVATTPPATAPATTAPATTVAPTSTTQASPVTTPTTPATTTSVP